MKKSLQSYHQQYYPMHMPGHKGGRMKLVENLYEIDVTEVEATDNLYEAKGIIKKSLTQIETFYGSLHSIFLVGGSTSGILASIGGLSSPGDTILVARNCHMSVFNALELFNLKADYVMPEMTEDGLVGGIAPLDVEDHLSKSSIKMVVLTSPTYDGYTSDIHKIAEICHQYGALLVVDEAHGGHFNYHPTLPTSALKQGADVVIQSPHKTLPIMTGAGLLHCGKEINDLQWRGIFETLRMIQTSSPSYMMMTQMSELPNLLGKEEIWDTYIDQLYCSQEKLSVCKNLRIDIASKPTSGSVSDKDPGKWLIISENAAIRGVDIYDQLANEYGFMLESYGESYALAILTIADTPRVMDEFCDAIITLDQEFAPTNEKLEVKSSKVSLVVHPTEVMLSYKSAIRLPMTRVALVEAEGKILAKNITPYPPGIPLYMAGEKINSKIIQQLIGLLDQGLNIQGIENKKVWILL